MTRQPNGTERERAERLAALRPPNWPQDAGRYVESLAQALADARTAGRHEAVEVIEALVPANARTPRLVDALDRARADA